MFRSLHVELVGQESDRSFEFAEGSDAVVAVDQLLFEILGWSIEIKIAGECKAGAPGSPALRRKGKWVAPGEDAEAVRLSVCE
ncbi:MAG: hypothetical protein HKN37_03070 [Rhodothermales bacterium]|nr:hypothetical protein [Rhodothermales bacterium]